LLRKLKSLLKKNKTIVTIWSCLHRYYYKYFFSDEEVIRKQFKKRLGREVNLENPVKFNDKLQWLKLNWKDPLAVKCADKYSVREFVNDKIGEEYLNELYAVYNSVDEIDLGELPEQFVLKGTHGSGFNIVCKDKNKMNWKKEKKKMKKWLKKNYHWNTREWVYKDIKPRIVSERYLNESNRNNSLTDYKIYCFNGEPLYCQYITRGKSNYTVDFFDKDWNHMPFTGLRIPPSPQYNKNIKKPDKYSQMLKLAAELSKGFPFVRVDFYFVDNKIYFGELTFFPLSGYGKFKPDEWNYKIGNLLKLSDI